MEYLNTAQELLDFIMRCKSPFHVVKEASDLLNENGYTKLEETKEWSLVPGGKYYVTRNESSVIAFQIPESAFSSYQIIASHSDCPTFKVKGEDPFVTDGHYTRLNVEGYGGMIRSPWFDRPLSLAGRMVVRDGNSVKSVLVDAGRDLVTIPNLPIHLNRDINNGIKYSVQTDMLPILGDETAKDHFYELFLPDTAKEDILSMELYLYNRVEGSIWGASKEFLSSGRLDDLQSAFGSLKGFLPFHQTIEVPGIEKNSRYEIKSGLEQLTTILIDNTQVEIKAVINLNLIAFSIGNRKRVQEVNCQEADYESLQKIPGLVGYIVKDGDDIWNIAKENHTSVREIMETNELSSDRVGKGDKLLIVKNMGA